MSTKRQPKGIPVGGQYAENSHDEAGMALSSEPETSASLTTALSRYGIEPSDVPGLSEAWTERYGNGESVELPPSHESVARDAGVIDDDDEVVGVKKDSKSGFYILDVEYEGDEDYDFYNSESRVISDPDDIAAMDAVVLGDREEAVRHQAELQSILNGQRTPWSVIDPSGYADAENEAQQARRKVNSLDLAERELREYDAAWNDVLSAAKAKDPDRIPFGKKLRGTNPSARWGSPEADTDMRNAAQTLIRREKRIERHRYMEEAMEQAQSLPEGALRDLLLTKRPESTYNTTEGTGRNKRTVLRTYTPKSELQSEYDSAFRNVSEDGGYSALVLGVETKRAQRQARVEDLSSARQENEDAQDRLYRVGWTGEGEPPVRSSES